jgi:hypothetical protein
MIQTWFRRRHLLRWSRGVRSFAACQAAVDHLELAYVCRNHERVQEMADRDLELAWWNGPGRLRRPDPGYTTERGPWAEGRGNRLALAVVVEQQ